jgi:hypothetical protein
MIKDDRQRGVRVTLIGAMLAFIIVLILAYISAHAQTKFYVCSHTAGEYDNDSGLISFTDSTVQIRELGDTVEIFQVAKVYRYRGGLKYYKLEHPVYSGFLWRTGHEAVLDIGFVGMPRRTQIYIFRKEN